MPHRLNAVIKALDWMAERIPHKVIHRTTRAKNQQLPNDVLVVTGSSERQLLPDGVVSLVLTDPPYHDDLQYGELSRLFHAWMAETLGGRVPDEQAEAVPNSVRGADDLHYAQQVAACLRESRRTLKKDGRLILTFHNRNLAAWGSLAGALRKAGFLVVGLATVSAENSADHSKRGKETFLCDLVIECKPAPRKRPARTTVTIQGAANTQERKELIAMGRALAACVNSRTRKDVSMLYPKYRGELGAASKLIS
jgi:adenine-specific DNA methylase